MSKDVKEVEESATVTRTARVMVKTNVGSLVVRPVEKDEPSGIIATRDIVNAIVEGKDPTRARVNETAGPPSGGHPWGSHELRGPADEEERPSATSRCSRIGRSWQSSPTWTS